MKHEKIIDVEVLARELNIRKVRITVDNCDGKVYVMSGYLAQTNGHPVGQSVVFHCEDKIVKQWDLTDTELQEQKIIEEQKLESLTKEALVKRLASLTLRVLSEKPALLQDIMQFRVG